MAEELKDLIEKIQTEGIKAAEDKAGKIEKEAEVRAAEIVKKAEKEASNLIAEATERITRMEASQETSLKQAGRNLMLSLKKEINSMLLNVTTSHVREALRPEELAKILISIVKDYGKKPDSKVIITVNKNDLAKIEKAFLGELSKEVKKGIVLTHAGDIHGGFIISYDGGKSHYDFTDKALAEYIASGLDRKLAELLQK